ncbi:hypothetical protein CSC12_4563 [Klebsiella michiganensis]|nr:hypothetical protein CSC12_4563 [Klebsiella michiganensis]
MNLIGFMFFKVFIYLINGQINHARYFTNAFYLQEFRWLIKFCHKSYSC